MIGWIVGKLKWLLLVAAVGGPVMAYLGHTGAAEKKDILARGVETTADIDGGTIRKGRKTGTTYSLDLHWTDAAGQRRSAEKVAITRVFADQIVVGEKLVRSITKIKYLPDAPETKPLIVEDAAQSIKQDEQLVPLMAGAGVLGMLGSAFFLWRGRRQA